MLKRSISAVYGLLILAAVVAALAWCIHWSWGTHGPVRHCVLWMDGTVTLGSLVLSAFAWCGVLIVVLGVANVLLRIGHRRPPADLTRHQEGTDHA